MIGTKTYLRLQRITLPLAGILMALGIICMIIG
jgi:hypothetical protein